MGKMNQSAQVHFKMRGNGYIGLDWIADGQLKQEGCPIRLCVFTC